MSAGMRTRRILKKRRTASSLCSLRVKLKHSCSCRFSPSFSSDTTRRTVDEKNDLFKVVPRLFRVQ